MKLDHAERNAERGIILQVLARSGLHLARSWLGSRRKNPDRLILEIEGDDGLRTG